MVSSRRPLSSCHGGELWVNLSSSTLRATAAIGWAARLGDHLDRRHQPIGAMASLALGVAQRFLAIWSKTSWHACYISWRRDSAVGGRIGRGYIDLLGCALDGAVMAVDNGTDCIAKIAQQVPAVRDLDRFRRALKDPVCISTGTIACDHLNAGMPAEPIGKRLGLPVWKKIDHLVALEVDKDCPSGRSPASG